LRYFNIAKINGIIIVLDILSLVPPLPSWNSYLSYNMYALHFERGKTRKKFIINST